ncbi:unnamed protein product [Discosporangium mesarthrocarpum]
MNVIKPGTVKRVNSSKMPFKQMENVSNFIKACRAVGVPEYSLFETVDLFEEKDVGVVVQCLHALGGVVQETCPDFQGPHLGTRIARKSQPKPKIQSQQKTPATASPAPARAPSHGSILANAAGPTASMKPADMIAPAPAVQGPSSAVTGGGEEHKVKIGTRGAGYGLDAELARKRDAKYDLHLEWEAREWMEGVTGDRFEGDFAAELKDGRRLCALVNGIRPGSVKRVNDSRMPFKQMENISNFIKVCRTLGVAEHSLFETVDLYEEKDLGVVVQCIHALGQTIQTTCPEFKGPHLGVKQAEANKREWTEEQQQQQIKEASMEISKMMAGSRGIMERAEVTKEGVTFGADYAGTGDSASVTQWSVGSSKVMQRAQVTKMGVTFGADQAGTGDPSSTSRVTRGY